MMRTRTRGIRWWALGLGLMVVVLALVLVWWPVEAAPREAGLVETPPREAGQGEALPRAPALAVQGSAGLQDFEGLRIHEAPTLKVYFTEPDEAEGTARAAAGGELARMLGGANRSLDLAVFELEDSLVLGGLGSLILGGARVRVMTDNEHGPRTAGDWGGLKALEGWEAKEDGRSALMHHKFAVGDGAWVWVGSTNLTANGLYRNFNNALWIDRPEVARAFSEEFAEMFDRGEFGRRSARGNGGRWAWDDPVLGPVVVEAWFSPEDEILPRLEALVAGAERELGFMAFSLTLPSLAEGMVAARDRGVAVRGVVEKLGSGGTGAQYGRLREAGLDVETDNTPWMLHHKVLVVDDTVVTGSLNFSRNALENNEESLVVVYNPTVAAWYRAELDKVHALARRLATEP